VAFPRELGLRAKAAATPRASAMASMLARPPALDKRPPASDDCATQPPCPCPMEARFAKWRPTSGRFAPSATAGISRFCNTLVTTSVYTSRQYIVSRWGSPKMCVTDPPARTNVQRPSREGPSVRTSSKGDGRSEHPSTTGSHLSELAGTSRLGAAARSPGLLLSEGGERCTFHRLCGVSAPC
jgi:hypothetical protein